MRGLRPVGTSDRGHSGPARPRPDRHRSRATLRELEERFAGRALAWVGGIALVAAAHLLPQPRVQPRLDHGSRCAVADRRSRAGSARSLAGAVLLAARLAARRQRAASAVGLGVIYDRRCSPPPACTASCRRPRSGSLPRSFAAAVVGGRRSPIRVRTRAASPRTGSWPALVAPPLVGRRSPTCSPSRSSP